MTQDPFAEIVRGLAANGFAQVEDFLSPEEVHALVQEANALRAAGQFRAAGVGQGSGLEHNSEIRQDETLWLDPDTSAPAQRLLLDRLQALQEALNQELFLGLWELEGHLAHYDVGAFYTRHLDRFQSDDRRVISCVLYLNRDWRPEHGGQLKIHAGPDTANEILVPPKGGTLVCFLSESTSHEVLKTNVPRLSFAGWFKRRALST